MTFRMIAAVGIALAFAASAAPASAAGPVADSICPEAAQYVTAVGKLSASDPAQKVYDAAQAAVDAFNRCSKDKLANGFREPQHYADTRASGFAVLAARALIALNRIDDAKRELKQYRPIAQNVVDWQAETETPYGSTANAPRATLSGDLVSNVSRTSNERGTSSDHRPSLYHNAALDVVKTIDAMLAQLGETGARPQAPAPAASPGH